VTSIEDFIHIGETKLNGVFMELTEAVDLLKELVNDCANLKGNDFLLAPSKIPGSVVEGYEIHITGKFNEEVRRYLSDLALKKELAITQHPSSVMLYSVKQLNAT
jgi:hypothetical protein